MARSRSPSDIEQIKLLIPAGRHNMIRLVQPRGVRL
jgi:hypothetical protein